MAQIQEFHINIEIESTAIKEIHRVTGFSKGLIKNIMFKGAVWLSTGKATSRIRRAGRVLKPGDALHKQYIKPVYHYNSYFKPQDFVALQ